MSWWPRQLVDMEHWMFYFLVSESHFLISQIDFVISSSIISWYHESHFVIILKSEIMSFWFLKTFCDYFLTSENQHWSIVGSNVVPFKCGWNIYGKLTLWGQSTCQRSPVDSPQKRSVMWNFDVFLVLASTRCSTNTSCRWFETPWRSCDVAVQWLCRLSAIEITIRRFTGARCTEVTARQSRQCWIPEGVFIGTDQWLQHDEVGHSYFTYHSISNISHTKSQNLNDPCFVLQLAMC